MGSHERLIDTESLRRIRGGVRRIESGGEIVGGFELIRRNLSGGIDGRVLDHVESVASSGR